MKSHRHLGFFGTFELFGIFEFTIDENRKGKKGAVIVAAKIQFDKEDRLEIVTYGLQPIELRNIKQYK